jgi:two-component sensor histidine kinase
MIYLPCRLYTLLYCLWVGYIAFGTTSCVQTAEHGSKPENTLYPDSLKQCLKLASDQRITCFLEVANRPDLKNSPVAMEAAQMALKDARSQGNRRAEARSLYQTAYLLFSNAKDDAYAEPLAQARMCADLSKNINYPLGAAKATALMAAIFSYSNDLPKSDTTLVEAYQHLSNVRGQYADSSWVAAYLAEVQVGNAARKGDLATASRWMARAPILYAASGDLQRMGHAYENIFKYHIQLSPNIDSAKFYLQKCTQYYTKVKDNNGLRSAYLNYAIACSHQYERKPHYETWFSEGIKAATLSQTFHGGQKYAEAIMQMGILYQQKGSLHRRDSLRYFMNRASEQYNEALQQAEVEKNEQALKTIIGNLQSACRLTGNCDSIIAQTAFSYQKLLDFRTKEAHKGQEQLEEYKNKQAAERRRTLILTGAVLLSLICMLFAWFYHRGRMQSLRRELEIKMEALRAQMNPHFISNCLNAIDSLVNHGKNQEASHYIIRFSRLCRMVLNNARHKFVTLSEELSMLDYFVALEKLRFGDDRLQYRTFTDATLNKDEIAVPPMLLQPFVENAIWHGIQPKQGPGLVQVNIYRLDASRFQCVVEDDGIGRKKSQEIKNNSVLKQPSWGMAITEERLQGFSGVHNATVVFEDLYTPQGDPAGTKVIITLPIQSLEQKSA